MLKIQNHLNFRQKNNNKYYLSVAHVWFEEMIGEDRNGKERGKEKMS